MWYMYGILGIVCSLSGQVTVEGVYCVGVVQGHKAHLNMRGMSSCSNRPLLCWEPWPSDRPPPGANRSISRLANTPQTQSLHSDTACKLRSQTFPVCLHCGLPLRTLGAWQSSGTSTGPCIWMGTNIVPLQFWCLYRLYNYLLVNGKYVQFCALIWSKTAFASSLHARIDGEREAEQLLLRPLVVYLE